MQNIKDRVVQYPRRYQLVPVQGQSEVYDLVPVPGTITAAGTAINRTLLMALQGFQACTTTFSGNTITETNASGHSKVTTFNANGTITEVFTGEGQTITKTTTFNANGSISEVIS